jgi:hypothetical protein
MVARFLRSPKNRRFFAAVACVWMFWAFGPLLAAKEPEATAKDSDKSGHPLKIAGFEDEGVYFLYDKEARVATLKFKWQKNGSFESVNTIAVRGRSTTLTVKVSPDKDGRWSKIVVESPRSPTTIEFTDGTATRIGNGKVDTLKLKPATGLFENLCPALMTSQVRLYDQAKAGKQTFPVLVIPTEVLDVTLERKEPATQSIGGRDVHFTRYAYALARVEITIWIDPDGKLVFADVPEQHANYVREGYEALMKSK